MQLYKINPNERPKYLDLLFKALKTVKPSSVEAEWAFSAMDFFTPKIRNRIGDKTLDASITLRQYYEPKKTLMMTNKTNFQNWPNLLLFLLSIFLCYRIRIWG